MTKARAGAEAAPVIMWFREDLRLADQPALRAACATRAPLLCVYILDEDGKGLRPLGRAARWWLHHSLAALSESLVGRGGRLDLLRGEAEKLIPWLAAESRAGALFSTRRYGGGEHAIDRKIEEHLEEAGVRGQRFGGFLLHEPCELTTKSGGFFRVYAPYWRAASALPEPDDLPTEPKKIAAAAYPEGGPRRSSLAALGLLPTKSDEAQGFRAHWTPGEAGARERLRAFLRTGLADYANARDHLARLATSNLSPHLRFGEISTERIFCAIRRASAGRPSMAKGAEKYRAELGWREFNYHVLFHQPDIAIKNFQTRFDAMDWRRPTKTELDAWREGRTGYPIVDAGMRELWATGHMHNRARMIAASFLVKQMLCDWRIGEAWFWDRLCDADPANNAMNWQWVAGTGADAAPFFRVYNPMLQGEKFDSEGEYVRRHIPALAAMPSKWIHRPWQAPADALRKAGVELGKTYPWPIVDHIGARARALAAFARIKG